MSEEVNARSVAQKRREALSPRPRCNGKYAGKQVAMTPEAEVVERSEGVAPPRPSGISHFVRKDLAKRLPAICERLGGQVVATGDMAALKVLLQLAGLDGTAVKKVEKVSKRKAWEFAREALEGFDGGSGF